MPKQAQQTGATEEGPVPPLVSFKAVRRGPQCPFANDTVEFVLRPQTCLWLTGNSGLGKTTLASYLAGLLQDRDLAKLGIQCTTCQWDPSLRVQERCGMLFQQTTLLDGLTVAANVTAALRASTATVDNAMDERARTKQLIELVGLDYARDGPKKPTELSGGMARRASLALQLAQHKRVIVLDEPFAGLDRQAALSVAKELWHLRHACRTAILLISHEPDYAAVVLQNPDNDGSKDTLHNVTVTLTAPQKAASVPEHSSLKPPSLFGISWWDRFVEKLLDYIFWSVPLIVLTFVACGLAIGMLSCDILARIDVQDQVMEILDTEVKPFLKFLTGQDDNAMAMMMIKMKVRGMMNTALPQAKATLYAVGMAKLFCLEIGPLLTGLLLCGRIGASYAGKVATLQATKQLALLQTLGLSPLAWTLYPSLTAACLAAPLLTVTGTLLAIGLGGLVGPTYGIGHWDDYLRQARDAIFPEWRLQWSPSVGSGDEEMASALFPIQTSFGGTAAWDVVVELATYPPCFLLCKAVVFILIIMLVAQTSVLARPKLTPRGVPTVITSSVVLASLLIITADWGFSQLWLQRY